MSFRRLLLAVALVFGGFAPAFGQITWNFTYSDSAGNGFNDSTVDSGETKSRGQLRKDSLAAATTYLNTIVDGRGTINANLNTSLTSGTGFLASFGPGQFTAIDGTFQNGGFYQAGRTDNRPFSGSDGSGQFNFGYAWIYAGQKSTASGYDMVSVAIHELTHGLGFLSLANSSGQGLDGNTVGNPDIYGGYDRFLQRGNGALSSSGLFNTDITSSGYGSFTGSASTFTNQNNTSTGLFFGGKYTREVFGGASLLYAPSSYQTGSSVSHVNDTSAVMNPSVTANTVKRFQPYEIAMLLDIGWNTYNWNSTTGKWSDGINSNGTFTLGNSRWTTDSGIVYDGTNQYNSNAHQAEAPVLPVYGQTTANIILNFKGSGTQNYTSTNDLNSVRLSRLNLNSTSSNAITITGGTLNFGLNSDGTPSVLVPKIVQSGSGAFTIASTIQTNTIATYSQTYNTGTANEITVTYKGHNGITVDGAGTGTVTISGNIVGTGGMTKDGTDFTLVQSGSNSYTGVTTVKGGVLSVSTLSNGGLTPTITTTSGSSTATVSSASGLSTGMTVSTANVPFGTTITAINGTTLTLSANATATGSGTAATIGTANGIGISTNAASNLVIGGGTLQYTGAAVSTDRLFTLGYGTNGTATGTLESSGTGAVTFTNTGTLGIGTDTQTVQVVTSGTNTVTLFSGGGSRVQVGLAVTGTGIASGTTISSISGDVITLSKNTTAGSTNTALTFAGGNRTLALGGTYTGGTNTLPAVITDPGVGTFTTSLTKNGAGTWAVSGANTYTGTTTVNAGTLYVNGDQSNATGAVTVSGGKLAGSGTLGGAVGVGNGGTLEAGNAGVGTLTVKNNVTVNNGGTLRAELGSGSSADLLSMSSGSYTLDLKTTTTLALAASGFDATSSTTYKLADLKDTTASLLKINGTDLAADSDITVFTSTGGNGGTNSHTNGSVDLSLSGFSFTSGDKLTLRRDAAGDLVVVFTPVPEPAGLLAVVGLAAGGGLAWRRWRAKKTLAA